MNKINRIIILSLIFISISIPGNNKVLVEILTNSHCPICPPAHSTINNFLQTANADNIEYIYYHMPFPYPSDELFIHNQPDSEAKNDFYGPHSSTPKAFFNGSLVGNSYSNWASSLNNLIAEESPFEISLSGSYTETNFSIQASVKQIANISASDLTINYVVVENLTYNGINGINNHKNVMREIVNPVGDLFNISLNETKDLQATIATNETWNKSKLKIIVFIQSKSDKKVYQSSSILYSDFTVTNTEDEPPLVKSYKLFQNYPNPFNPTTTIKYTIPIVGTQHAVFLQLTIYDVLGNEIKTLINKKQNPGNYEIQFDASSLTSGIYYYQLRVGNFIQTKKMTLIK